MSELNFYDLTYDGPVVQAILDTAQKLRTDGYIFMGAGTPSTVPGTPTQRVWYLCGPGTYANFGSSVTVPEGSVMVAQYASGWTKTVIEVTSGGSAFATDEEVGDVSLFDELSDLNGKTDAQKALMLPNAIGLQDAAYSKIEIGKRWLDGKAIMATYGGEALNNNFVYTEYLDISQYDCVYVPTIATSTSFGVAFYDASKNYIFGRASEIVTTDYGKFIFYRVQTRGAKYMRLTAYRDTYQYFEEYPKIYAIVPKVSEIVDELCGDGYLYTTTWASGYIDSYGEEKANANYCRSGYIPSYLLESIVTANDALISLNLYRNGKSLGLWQNYSNVVKTLPRDCDFFRIWFAWTNVSTASDNVEIRFATPKLLDNQTNLLSGKSAVTFGDSITWYDGHAYNWGKENGKVAIGYQSYMRNCGMVVDNQGASGQDMTQISAIVTSYANFANMDFCTITSGANDTRKSIPVGTIADIGSTYDTSTFIGALQTSIDYALTQNPKIKIALFTPIKGWIYGGGYVPTRQTDGMVDEAYATAIKQVGALYSLPVLDLFNLAGINLLTRNVAMNDPEPPTNTLYSLHPSTYEYRRMADLILPFLSSM